MKPSMLIYDDNGDEVQIPGKFEVCSRCGGHGVHDHPAFSNGIDQEQFDEDDEFREAYHAGAYDVTCGVCHGRNVEVVPDEDALNDDQKRWLASWYEGQATEAAERRMRERGIQF